MAWGKPEGGLKALNEQDLAAMRQEVLRWIARDRQRAAPGAVGRQTSSQPMPTAASRGAGMTDDPTRLAERQGNELTGPSRDRVAGVVRPPVVAVPRRRRANHVAKTGQRALRRHPPQNQKISGARNWPWLQRLHASWVGVGVVTGIGLVAVVGAWAAIYLGGWDGPWVRDLARVFPLPAAIVDGTSLSLAEFLAEVERLRASPPPSVISDRGLKDYVIAQFAGRVALLQIAQDLDLDLTALNGQRQTDRGAAKVGSPSWTLTDFRAQAVQLARLRQAIVATLANRPMAWDKADQAAASAYAAITAGEVSFAEAAARYSRHESAGLGGEVGYVGVNHLDPEVFRALVNAPLGSAIAPIRSDDGYVIAQAEGFVGVTSSPEFRIHVRQIIIPPVSGFDELLAEKLSALQVHRFVP